MHFKPLLRGFLPDVLAVIGLLLLSFIYFFTPATQGMVLTGHDFTGGVGAGTEIEQYRHQTGETTRWTNSIFGGMPTYQMAPSYKSAHTLYEVSHIYELFTQDALQYLFILLLGFYILLRAFNFKVHIACLGAVLWAFSSYFLIIISAGHIWKVLTLAYIPPTIAGLVLCYRGKLLWGGLLTAFFGAIQIMSNHIQMSYYFFIVMLCIVIAYAVQAGMQKAWAQFFKATGVLFVAGLVALACNAPNLYHTYEYAKESMRGRPALDMHVANLPTPKATPQEGALEIDYITQWSYGIPETWTLLVPNVMGGGSGSIMDVPRATAQPEFANLQQHLAQTYQALQQQAPQMANYLPGLNSYWGDQPMTVGPVYVGAIVCLLFVLGLLIVRGPMKWALLAATIFSFFIAWGKNFMPFTEFLVDYFPLYDKFRAVSSGLVIAEFTMPLLAIMALVQVVRNPLSLGHNNRNLYIAFICTGFMALILAIMPTFLLGDLLSQQEANIFTQLSQVFPSDFITSYKASLSSVRAAIVAADAWRSFFFILGAVVLLLLYRMGKLREYILIALLFILCLVDLWSVDKRYLNDSKFVENIPFREQIKPTATDLQIMADTTDYRVLNFASNTFNENETSLFHKSIGGYSAVKLRAYQDLIDNAIQPEMQTLAQAVAQTQGQLETIDGDTLTPVLNMLNTKYFIFPLQNNSTAAITNPWSAGNGWFISQATYVDTPQKEMATLRTLNTRHAIVAQHDAQLILGQPTAIDSTASVQLTKYLPNELHYTIHSKVGGIVVFSEVYYPGWVATIDGKEVPIARVNYLLRALRLTPGTHQVVFTFHPASVTITETIAFIAMLLLMHLFFLAIFLYGRQVWRAPGTKTLQS